MRLINSIRSSIAGLAAALASPGHRDFDEVLPLANRPEPAAVVEPADRTDVLRRAIRTEDDAAEVRQKLVDLLGEEEVRKKELFVIRHTSDPAIVERAVDRSQEKRLARAARVAARIGKKNA